MRRKTRAAPRLHAPKHTKACRCSLCRLYHGHAGNPPVETVAALPLKHRIRMGMAVAPEVDTKPVVKTKAAPVVAQVAVQA